MFVIYGLLILSILVFVHELGHFLAAKLCKVPVEAFSIGFGKPILKKKIGETEYRLSPIPFGGYVKMVGDEGTLNNSGFNNHPIWQRALIAFAGPLFNFIFAYIILMFMVSGDHAIYDYIQDTKIGAVQPNSASYGKFEVNDSIVSINGKEMKDWHQIQREFLRLDDSYKVLFYRQNTLDSVTFSIPLPSKKSTQIKESGLSPLYPPIVENVRKGSIAEKGGLKPGDEFVQIDSFPISSYSLVQYLIITKGKDSLPLEVTVKRKDSLFTTTLTPEIGILHISKGLFGKRDTLKAPMIGIEVQRPSYKVEKGSFSKTIKRTNKNFLIQASSVFTLLNPKKLVKLVRYMSGPIGIIQTSGKMAERGGMGTILSLLVLLSINLGILNLLPLVITDGGILFFLLIEAIRKKPVSIQVQELLTKIFFILFLSLFLFVTFNDIRNYERNDKMIEGK